MRCALTVLSLVCLPWLALAQVPGSPAATNNPPPWTDGLRRIDFARISELLSRRLYHEVLSGELAILRESVVSVMVVALGLGIAFVLVREARRRVLVVEPFDVAPSLQAQGLTGAVMARRLRDQLAAIQDRTAATVGARNLFQAGLPAEQELTIPVAHVSLGALFDYVRGLLGKVTYVDGEVTAFGDAARVTVRLRGRPASGFGGRPEELDKLMLQAAISVLQHSNPYMLAVYLRDTGDADGAIAVLKRTLVIGDAKAEAAALCLWGQILRQRGDTDGAIAKFEAATRVSPNHDWSYENLADTLLARGSWAEADRLLAGFVRRRSRRAVGQVLLALSRLYRYDLTGAGKHLRRALRYDRRNTRALSLMVRLLVLAHDQSKALMYGMRMARIPRSRFTEADAFGPLNALAVGNLGLRNYDAAREYAQQQVDETPEHWSGWINLGRVAFAQRRYQEALEYARRANALRPQLPLTQPIIVASLRALGKHDEAESEARASLASNPLDAPLRAALGDALVSQGDIQGAISEYRRATEDVPSIADGFEGWGRALAALGQWDAAVIQFRQAAQVAPAWSAPHIGWGDVLLVRGDVAGAVAHFHEAVRLDPRWWEAHARLAEGLARQGNKEAAARHQARATELEAVLL